MNEMMTMMSEIGSDNVKGRNVQVNLTTFSFTEKVVAELLRRNVQVDLTPFSFTEKVHDKLQIKVVEKEKNDRSNTVNLVAAIYEDDYKFNEHDTNISCPTIERYSAMVRFEFTKGTLYISMRKPSSRVNHIVRIHLKCEKLEFSETLTCAINWSDWIKIANLPPEESSSSDGKIHVLKMSINLCELRNKTFINLLEDKDFYDVILISDEKIPANVAMHKAVLSAHSSLFRSLLLGEWKDALEVKMKMNNANHQTLLDLREYLYLGVLPNRNLLPLILVAKNYSFEGVLKECIFEIVNMVDSNNLLQFRQFAIDNELVELIDALHQITSDEIARATYRLEMLKLTQVNARSLIRKRDSTQEKRKEIPQNNRR